MSLGEKILEERKKKGLSGESLAEKIGVTRQTISNWELNETSPSAKELKLLSKEFNISIDELLENDVQNLIVEKESSLESLSKIIIKILTIVLIGILLLIVSFILFKTIKTNKPSGPLEEKSIYCNIFNEEHGVTIKYDTNNNEITKISTDGYFDTIIDLNKYNTADAAITKIKNYSQEHGGTCTVIEERNLNDLVNLYVKEGTLTKESLTVVIEEKEEYDISYGEPFYIEKYNYKTNSFEKLNYINDNCGFILPAYHASPEKPLEMYQNYSCMYGELSKGLYRIVKDVFFNSDIPIDESKIFYISAEFEIEE